MASEIEPRRGMPDPRLSEQQFKQRFLTQFADPAFSALSAELERIAAAAWDGYCNARKSPRTGQVAAGADLRPPREK